MKANDFKKDLKKLTMAQQVEKLTELRRELFTLRLNSRASQAQDVSQFKKLRRNIARLLTAMNQNNHITTEVL